MGKRNKPEEITLLFDAYHIESKNLHNSFVTAGIPCNVVVINDDGFLPEGVDSMYEYFLGGFKKKGKSKYFNEIDVPDFWEISSTNNSGEIHDLNKLRARMFYSIPTNTRIVRCVEWLDDNGVVRSCDYYNRFGTLYARATFDKKQKIILKSYFDSKNREIIVEDYVTNDIILNYKERVMIFKSKADFVMYYLKERGLDNTRLFINSLGTPFFVSNMLEENNKSDVLFWQEYRRDDIPGNMQYIIDGRATRVGSVYVQKKDAYDALVELGVPESIVKCKGYVYPYARNTKRRKNALILTNSDKVEHIIDFIEALSDVHFYIGALTEMSSKLLSLGKYDNVSLYPTITSERIDDLYGKCDIYLDINRENEIVNAVNRAFLNNQLIFAFDETIHNINYVAKANRFKIDDYEDMIEMIRKVCADKADWDDNLDIQRGHALSESPDSYIF